MPVKLSICISTFNRAAFIGATLESIIAQATSDCEIVVLDGASSDDTAGVVSAYTSRFDRLRYIRQETNNGIDRDFNRAVEFAEGEYCWLLSDDDLLKPGAVAAVLEALRGDYSLVLVNGEHRNRSMSSVLIPNFFGISENRVYSPRDMSRLFTDMGTCLICICCVVIKRAIWLEREREPYFGSMFVHVGVIFQAPLPGDTLVIAQPLMSLRLGNEQAWAGNGFEIWIIKWPSLVWSLALPERAKRSICSAEPWRRLRYLLGLRATGKYSSLEYQRWIRPRLRSFRQMLVPTMISLLPTKLAHYLYVVRFAVSGDGHSPHDACRSMFPESLRNLRHVIAQARDG